MFMLPASKWNHRLATEESALRLSWFDSDRYASHFSDPVFQDLEETQVVQALRTLDAFLGAPVDPEQDSKVADATVSEAQSARRVS